MRATFCLITLLSLSACRTITDPSFMPSGYTYHQDLYKSPPGPEAKGIGYDYNAISNAEVLQLWHISLNDLINQLEDERGELPKELYIRPVDHIDAFNTTFDHVLREELENRGHTLKSEAGDELILTFDAAIPDSTFRNKKAEYNDDVEYETPEQTQKKITDIILSLSTSRAGLPLEQASGTYTLPLYGYTHTKWHEDRP